MISAIITQALRRQVRGREPAARLGRDLGGVHARRRVEHPLLERCDHLGDDYYDLGDDYYDLGDDYYDLGDDDPRSRR